MPKRLNSLDRWPTVVLLTMLHHGESVGQPGPRFTAGDILLNSAKGVVHPWESPQCKLGEISVLSIALTLLQIDPSHLFQ